MSYPEGEWIVDAWVEGVVCPTFNLQQAIVHAPTASAASDKAAGQLGKDTGGAPIVVSVRRVDMNYPGETFKP
jgi:hypothetical protein